MTRTGNKLRETQGCNGLANFEARVPPGIIRIHKNHIRFALQRQHQPIFRRSRIQDFARILEPEAEHLPKKRYHHQ